MDEQEDNKLSIINEINMEAIEAFTQQIYYCDPYTSMHEEHVAELMAGLASQMSMSSDEISLAFIVGLIHDIGKIKTPRNILNKPGRLTDEEYKIMKEHAQQGADMLSAVEGAEAIIPVMRHHHERYDGKGYPQGLCGENIPLLSRMLALCDVFDAMTTERCYKEVSTLEESVAEIKRCSGTQFDPQLCELFIEFLTEQFGIEVKELKK